MKLAVTITTPDVPVPIPVALLDGVFGERLRKAAAMGYDGVELMVLDPTKLDAGEVRSKAQAAGLAIAAIASGAQAGVGRLTLLAADQATRDEAAARLRQLVDFAAAVGAPLVTIGGFRGRLAAAGDGARAILVAALQAGANHAAAQNVRLVLEPLNRYETDIVVDIAEGLALIEAVGCPNVGLLLDTFHANIEEPSPAGALRQAMAAGRLWHVHLGDSNRLAPGMGHIDFGAIVSTLAEIGYTGYLSAELLPQPAPDAAALATIRHMRRSIPSPDREGG